MIRLLLQNGANTDAVDRENRTCLLVAARRGHLEIVQLLVEVGGADIEVSDKGRRTALMHATLAGHISVVNYLLEIASRTNRLFSLLVATDIAGETALTHAARASPSAALVLQAAGASLSPPCHSVSSPVSMPVSVTVLGGDSRKSPVEEGSGDEEERSLMPPPLPMSTPSAAPPAPVDRDVHTDKRQRTESGQRSLIPPVSLLPRVIASTAPPAQLCFSIPSSLPTRGNNVFFSNPSAFAFTPQHQMDIRFVPSNSFQSSGSNSGGSGDDEEEFRQVRRRRSREARPRSSAKATKYSGGRASQLGRKEAPNNTNVFESSAVASATS